MWLYKFIIAKYLEQFYSNEMIFMRDLLHTRINPFPHNAGHS